MTGLLLGWGTPYYEGGTPAGTPFLSTNRGVMDYVPGDWNFNIAEDSALPVPPEFTCEIKLTFLPADGSEPLVRFYYDQWELNDPFFHEGDVWYWAVLPGIYELSGFANGIAFDNTLTAVLTPSEFGYGVVSYYGDAGDTPASEFWTAFLKTKEVP